MKCFVENALPHMPFWDLCCDHGYIGIHALLSERFTEVHFVDQIEHIMLKLKERFEKSKQVKESYNFQFHICDAEKINNKIFGNLLIAGVSATTVINIISSLSLSGNLNCKRILLSPHSDTDMLLEFMKSKLAKEYFLVKQVSIYEGKRDRSLYVYDSI